MLKTVPAKYIVTESDKRAVELGYWWNRQAIKHVLKFAATLRSPMNPDRPYRLLKWQRRVVYQLFGWRRPDGRRRFSKLNTWIAKKNGKTSFLAFLALVFLLVDGESRPGCYVTSATGDLAEEIYTEAKAMTLGTPWRRVLEIKNFRKRLNCIVNGGTFAALAASAEGAEGLKGSFVCIDEIHATLKKNPKLYGSLRFAGSGRKQPLVSTISTAGDDRQGLPFKIYARAKLILSGEIIDLHTLAVVFEAEDKDEYTDADFIAANPSIGEVLELSQIRDDYNEAKISEYEFELFKRYRLNVWTKRSTAWLDCGEWVKCRDELPDITGRAAWLGVDLSTRLDLTAVCAVIPIDNGVVFIPHFWLPKAGIEDRIAREMDYKAAADAGAITLIDGQQIDYSHVESWIKTLGETVEIKSIGFDPYKAADMAKNLEGAGFDCVSIKQGWAMSEPSFEFERLIKTREAIHGGNAVMSWCIENVEIRRDWNGKIRPVKPIERNKRIDGIIAAIQGLYLSMFAEEPAEFFCG